MIARLDRALTHFAQIIHRDLGIDVLHLEGGGAAGGMVPRSTRFAGRSCARGLRL
ncbi:glycerate kinase I [Raoultella terrigena]|uniref:Glycerate kinase I n=1 Tax=Raoultella terrigena TaxID=577 RepID=A0A3P8M1L8_RAOTE|nr:glycerate kinase I [Raoultella terrigena]